MDTNYSRKHFNLPLDHSIKEMSSLRIKDQIQGRKFCHKRLRNGYKRVRMVKISGRLMIDKRLILKEIDSLPLLLLTYGFCIQTDYESVGRRFESCWARQ